MADPGFQNNAMINVRENGVGQTFQVAQVTYHDIYWWGTFDGATVKLQASPDGKEWFDVTTYTKTDRDFSLGEMVNRSFLRWVVTGAGTNTNVSAAVI